MPALEPQTSPPTPSPKPAPGRHSPAAAAAIPDLIQFGATDESEANYISSAPPQHAVSSAAPSKRSTSTAGNRPRPVEKYYLLNTPARQVLYKRGEYGQLASFPATTAPSTPPANQQHRQPHDQQVPAVSSELLAASDMATPPFFRPPAPTSAGLDAMCIPRCSAPFTARIDLGAFEHSLGHAPPAQHAVYYANKASAPCPEHGYGVHLAAGWEPASHSTPPPRFHAPTAPKPLRTIAPAPSDQQARAAATHIQHVGQLLLRLRANFLLPLERATPIMPDDAELINDINSTALQLNERLLDLSATCSSIAADLLRKSSDRRAVLPDMAGDRGLVACLSSDLTRYATELMLLYHQTYAVRETLAVAHMLPVAVTVSSRLLHYASMIRNSITVTHAKPE